MKILVQGKKGIKNKKSLRYFSFLNFKYNENKI